MHYCYTIEKNCFQPCGCHLTDSCSEQIPSNTPNVFAFVDESEREQTHYFMGAIVAAEPQVQQITAAMDATMQDFSQQFSSLNPATEFHGSEMMNGHGPWKKVSLRAKFAMFKKVFTAIHSSGARVFVEGIHYAKLTPAANANLTPRERAFSHLFEQINHYGAPNNLLQVIADEHHDATTSRSNFSRYRVTGTYGYKPNKLEYINPDLHFEDSATSRLLQASDMVTYIFNRLHTIQEKNPKATRFKQELWSTFNHSPHFPTEGRGRIWP